ncbi:DUF4189 domain-containing protein [Leeia oryzae]|uniref:DUF4189 domain-containing protein n=1 Tax=Leeia oryzae TaxID=356662 RepID=UPI00068837BC|nr:DUF4189 domain-containing protein [Leeia oryzae]
MKQITLLLCMFTHIAFADAYCPGSGQINILDGICYYPDGSHVPHPAGSVLQSQPRDYYGAIAADVVDGKSSGHADNFQAQGAAQSGALETCGLSGCQIIISYKNACGSMVAAKTPIGSPNHVVGGVGNTPAEAEQNAFTECEHLNPGVQCLMWSKGKCSYRE